MDDITIHEGNTGILRFGNGDLFVPSYDIEAAWGLTLEFMNLTDAEGTPLKEYFEHDGFNWGNTVISDVMWEYAYPYVQYRSLLNTLFTNTETPKVTYSHNQGSGGRFSTIYELMFREKVTKRIQYESAVNRPTGCQSAKDKIKKTLRKIGKKLYKVFSNELPSGLYPGAILFDVMHKNNFRTATIESILDNLGYSWVKTPGDITKSYKRDCGLYLEFKLSRNSQFNGMDEVFFDRCLKKIEGTISDNIFCYEIHKRIIEKNTPKVFLSMDEANSHVYPMLYACKKNNVPTVGFQHTYYSSRRYECAHPQLELRNYQWFDKIVVWGNYWKYKLEMNINLSNTDVMTVCNRYRNHEYHKIRTKTGARGSLNILVPYEFLSDSDEISRYIDAIIKLGHTVYFKWRPDEQHEDQAEAYNLSGKQSGMIKYISNLDSNIVDLIDAVIGTQTTILYELLPFKIPIFVPVTGLTLLQDMVQEGLARQLEIEEIDRLPEMIKEYVYKGNIPDYYFAKEDPEKALKELIDSYVAH